MSITLSYTCWEDLGKVECDVINAIDEVTIYAEDMNKGKVKITVEYIGQTWEKGFESLIKDVH